MTQGREGNILRFAKELGGSANEFLPLLTAVGKFCYLLIHIDIDIQKTGRVLMNDAFLLAIEEMQEPPVFLEFVL